MAKSYMEEQSWKLVYTDTGPQMDLDNSERISKEQTYK